MTHVFHPEAQEELAEDAIFYDQRVPGLGDDFLDEVVFGIRRIVDAPSRWPRYDGDIRRHLVHRFPYSILYSVEANHILWLPSCIKAVSQAIGSTVSPTPKDSHDALRPRHLRAS